MLKELYENHYDETLRGHILRGDLPGPGKILRRYTENGIVSLSNFVEDPESRSIVQVPENYNQDIVINRPCMVRFTSNFKHTLFVKSERVFIDGQNFTINEINCSTDETCYIPTSEIINKIIIADFIVEKLIIKDVKNLMIFDCNIVNQTLSGVNGIMRIES